MVDDVSRSPCFIQTPQTALCARSLTDVQYSTCHQDQVSAASTSPQRTASMIVTVKRPSDHLGTGIPRPTAWSRDIGSLRDEETTYRATSTVSDPSISPHPASEAIS